MTLMDIPDDFWKGLCDRRPAGLNVASRFVCVSVYPLSLIAKWEPLEETSVRELENFEKLWAQNGLGFYGRLIVYGF